MHAIDLFRWYHCIDHECVIIWNDVCQSVASGDDTADGMQRQLVNASGNWGADVETLKFCFQCEALFHELAAFALHGLQIIERFFTIALLKLDQLNSGSCDLASRLGFLSASVCPIRRQALFFSLDGNPTGHLGPAPSWRAAIISRFHPGQC